MKTKLFLAAMMALALTACSNKKANTENVEAEAQEFETLSLDGKWRLADFAGTEEVCFMDSTQNYYLQFNEADHTFGLTTDCNSIGGEFVAVADSLRFENIAMTQMMCPDAKVEENMARILPMIDTYAVIGDSILSLRVDHRTYATFTYVKE